MGHDHDAAREERHYLARSIRRTEYLTITNLGILAFLFLTQVGESQEVAGNVLLFAFIVGMGGWFYEMELIYELRKDIRRHLRNWWDNR